jgi:sugar phosphate isomerase/epimerase
MGIRSSGLRESISIAGSAGFDGVEIDIREVANLIEQNGASYVRALFADAGVRPAGWGLPVAWNGPEEQWRKGIEELTSLAKAAQQIGCLRTMTWIMPGSNDRAYDENRRFHIDRFGPLAEVLAAHDVRLGLEFIGPKTIRDTQKHQFVYRMLDMVAMGAEIGPNVGLLLDCWHWHTSGGTVDELLSLRPEQVVYVHINDAPVGVAMDAYIDNQRCLPGATGVIDTTGFLQALNSIGYDGPVVPEPFGSPASWAADALRGVWKQAGL